MRISRCTRCDQLIEYDASYEGEEVLCPACDNITRLQEIPPDELPDLDVPEDASEDSRPPRAPLRIAADSIPKPDHDPVAPLKADEVNDSDLRGPGKLEDEPAPLDRDAPISERIGSKRKSKSLNNGKAVSMPEGTLPEIKILEGADSVAFFGGDSSSDRDDTITIPAKVAIPIILLLALGVLAIKFWPEKDHQAEGRERTMEMRAQIEQQMAELRASVDPIKPEPVPDPVGTSGASPMPTESLSELVKRGPDMQRTQRAFVGTNVVTVEFPELPRVIQRSVTKYEDQAYQTYVETALQVPYRLFGDTVFDLRTLGFALRRGMTAFTNNWQLVGGVVTRRTDEGLFLRLDRRYFLDSRIVFIEKFPSSLGFVADLPLGVLGRKTDSRELEVSDGEKKTVEVYQFGSMPSKPMIEIVQMKALEREKIVRNRIAAVERKKAEDTKAEEDARKRANDKRAVAYLQKRVAQGSASALYSLGVRHLDGSGVPKNRNEAVRLIREAAKKGVSQAKKKLKELGEK